MRVDRRLLAAAVRLPPRVAVFYLRAQLLARRHGDRYSLTISSRPEDLALLLSIAKGRRHVVELGTGAGWEAAALALADQHRQVITYDPVTHAQREFYFALIGPDARARIDLRSEPAAHGPADHDLPVELLFIAIGGHTRVDTLGAFYGLEGGVGAVVAFHDYRPAHPGVAQAISDLRLRGDVAGRSFIHLALTQSTRGRGPRLFRVELIHDTPARRKRRLGPSSFRLLTRDETENASAMTQTGAS